MTTSLETIAGDDVGHRESEEPEPEGDEKDIQHGKAPCEREKPTKTKVGDAHYQRQ
jgi:hypothetical protein